MHYLKQNWKTVCAALAAATAFAIVDQYIVNASSYLCGFLLAGIWMDKHKSKPETKKKQTGRGSREMSVLRRKTKENSREEARGDRAIKVLQLSPEDGAGKREIEAGCDIRRGKA